MHSFTCQVSLAGLHQISQLVERKWKHLSVVTVPGKNTTFQWPLAGNLELLGKLVLYEAKGRRYIISTVFVVRFKRQLFHTQVQFQAISADLSVLSKPQWSRISWLELQNFMLDVKDFAQLAKAQWPFLRYLSIIGDDLDTALLHLDDSYWPKLAALSIKTRHDLAARQEETQAQKSHQLLVQSALNSTCTTARLPTMASSPQLVRLEMQRVMLKAGLFVQLSNVYHARLEVLCLSCVGLTAKALSDLLYKPWPHLQDLDISNNKLAKDSMAALVRAELPNLQFLNLGQNKLDLSALQYLSIAKWPHLESLWLCDNLLDDQAMPDLWAGDWPRLSKSYFCGNSVGARVLQALSLNLWPCL